MAYFRKLNKIISVLFVIGLLAIIIPIAYINNQTAYNENSFISSSSQDGIGTYKLFNRYVFKKTKLEGERFAYLGGFPVGISVKAEGVIVDAVEEVNTQCGVASLKEDIQAGDIILSIDDKKVFHVEDISEILQNLDEKIATVPVNILRGKKHITVNIAPLIEEYTSEFKLGLSVKDGITGVGTITFVKQNGDFGALGHPICNTHTRECLPCHSGKLFECKIVGVNRSKKGRPGELRTVLRNAKRTIGSVVANNKYGVYGNIKNFDGGKLYEIAPRMSVLPGKALIYTTVNDETDFYEIEIMKANHQATRNDKSMVVRITDKRLLEATGGVVQGMSGSPIVQNDKIVGAVTHVFVNDPTKGYGIYLDWMFDN